MLDGYAPDSGHNHALVNTQAEQALLGALIVKPQLLDALPPSFSPSHYGYGDHEEIHRALVEVGKPGQPATLLLKQALALNDEDKWAYIVSLLSAAVTYLPGGIATYAEAVTDFYRRRHLVALSDQIREGAFTSGSAACVDGTIARSLASLDNLIGGHGVMRPPVTLDEALGLALQKAEEAGRRNGPAGLSTGFPAVDEMLGGLENSTLTVLAGRPGTGKSAYGWAIALNVAKNAQAARDAAAAEGRPVGRDGGGVLAISLEMSAAELGRRAFAVHAGVSIQDMKHGKIGANFKKLAAARAELGRLPLTIEDGGGLTAAMISMKARAAHRRHGLGLIMIDHLHIIRPEDGDAKHGGTWAVGRISGAMKRLAKEFDCPVLLLAQLNRGVESRDDKRPMLADLRQAGEIEQDADAVMFLYRAEYYMTKEPEEGPNESREQFTNRLAKWQASKAAARGKAELIVAKVRDGATGSIDLMFDGQTTSFSEAPVEMGYSHDR